LLDRLEGDQFGELARDICHRIFCSVQAASRAEQRADFAESFTGINVRGDGETVAGSSARAADAG
jgi:hypothetical protein